MTPVIDVQSPAPVFCRCNCCGSKADAGLKIGWRDGNHGSSTFIALCWACLNLLRAAIGNVP